MLFDSKLPDVGTTIFTVMSRRAVEENALNIGQGFPDYPIDPRLAHSLSEAVAAGRNQYAPMEGAIELREQISSKLHACYQQRFDPADEITVTCGATEALYDAIQAVAGAGDEVIIFDPAYDAYEPAVRLAGARCVRIALAPPAFRFDWEEVRRALSARTRLIIINSPQNPSCSVATRQDLDALAACVRDRPITILADEVYEHVLFDGRKHASVLAHPELRERSYAVFSFGKTLHATGWRVGYCVAPAKMTRELRKVHQFNTFSIAAPLQHAIARYLSSYPDAWHGLAAFFEAKRDLLTALLSGSGFVPVPAAGTYFQLIDYGAFSDASDVDFADRLIREAKIATIPLSPFYANPPAHTLLRLCIAKQDATLRTAAERLCAFAGATKRRAG
ncbi:MAG TPA: methionine aminotransferase [Steroidobacteraceae bacterium]|jgi:methionine aminotransferase|nr:methionine aminotransferase [Steroidobacteraceae bacterium]